MPYATHSTPVNASSEEVWSTLLDKAEHPERYIPYKVTELKIHERSPNGLLREVRTENGGHIIERITWDKAKGEMLFTYIDDPVYTGTTLNAVSPAPGAGSGGGTPTLTFTLDVKPRTPEAEQRPEAEPFKHLAREGLQHALMHVKEIIEQKSTR